MLNNVSSHRRTVLPVTLSAHLFQARLFSILDTGTPEDLANALAKEQPGQPDVCLDEWGDSLLVRAVRIARTDMVEVLIRHGMRLNDVDAHGWSPLHIAASAGNAELLMILINAGADMATAITRGPHEGMDAIHVAAMSGQFALLSTLRDAGMDITKAALHGKYAGWNALHIAAGKADIALLRKICGIWTWTDSTAKVQDGKYTGWNAVQLAAFGGAAPNDTMPLAIELGLWGTADRIIRNIPTDRLPQLDLAPLFCAPPESIADDVRAVATYKVKQQRLCQCVGRRYLEQLESAWKKGEEGACISQLEEKCGSMGAPVLARLMAAITLSSTYCHDEPQWASGILKIVELGYLSEENRHAVKNLSLLNIRTIEVAPIAGVDTFIEICVGEDKMSRVPGLTRQVMRALGYAYV